MPISFTPNPDGFWLWRDEQGQLWLMFKTYRVGVQAESAEQLEAFLKEKGVK